MIFHLAALWIIYRKFFWAKGIFCIPVKSRPMAKIVEDKVGRHDFLLTPCFKDTFRIIYNDKNPHHGCEGNLIKAFDSLGLKLKTIPTTFNLFMNVVLDQSGLLYVVPATSKAHD